MSAAATAMPADDGPTALPPPSATVLSDDALTEILVRTPVKSLIRFKTVSKHWLSLISSPQFSLLHTHRNPTPKLAGLLLRKTPFLSAAATTAAVSAYDFVPLNPSLSRSPPFRSLDFIHHSQNKGTRILQSCKGLMLCSSFPRNGQNTRNYYVVNPTTKEYRTLDPPRNCGKTSVLGVNLVFDPSKSPHYKVLWVRSTLLSKNHYSIEIYSSERRSWRDSWYTFTAPSDMVFSDGLFWNSSIHWMSRRGDSLRFDVDLEDLGEMLAIPVFSSDKRRYRNFCESNGHLHLVEVYGLQTTQFRVLEMDCDYSGWYEKYYVNLSPVVVAFPEVIRGQGLAFSILAVIRDDNEDESLLVLNIPGRVVSVNFEDGTTKELLDVGPGKNDKSTLQFGFSDSYQYIETLAPV